MVSIYTVIPCFEGLGMSNLRSTQKICLASDNWAPAHPSILKAVMDANQGFSPSYGADSWTEQVDKEIQRVFNSSCKVFVVPTGTGANILALKIACQRYSSVICTDIAHIHYQESGAAESIVGCKLLTVPHVGGKITKEGILKKLKSERAFGKHSTHPQVLSIAQPTEVGTVYTLEELGILSKLCKEENLLFHIDGSRLYNAVVSLCCPLHEMTEAANVDLLSLGGTKNGLMGAEALLIFNPHLIEGSDHLHKQTLGLLSKMRYLSAQYLPFFQDGLWNTLAHEANRKARQIAAIIAHTPHLLLSYPVESNQIFFIAPQSWIPLIQEKVFCYPWDIEKGEVRFIASWNTSEQDIERLKAIFSEICHHPT
jgi:threonine aldolase